MSAEADETDYDQDEAAVARVRRCYTELYRHLSLNDTVTMSADGTMQLGLGRDGFTYGETTLRSTWHLLQHVRLPEFACHCASPSDDDQPPTARCSVCGLRGVGATIVDLGSGIGNVVVGAALLCAAGNLEGRVGSLHGVELLPTLHAAATDALARLPGLASRSGFANPLPPCELHCADLLDFDLREVDVVYMASTVFEEQVLAAFATRAAAQLRPGSRVVTLGSPLKHAAFVQVKPPQPDVMSGALLRSSKGSSWRADSRVNPGHSLKRYNNRDRN